MESFHNRSGSYTKAPKIKVPPGMKAQQLMIGCGRYQSSSVSPTYDSYAENLDLNAPILRYLCSGSPIAGKLGLAGGDRAIDAASAVKYCHPFNQFGGGSGGSGSGGLGSRGIGSPSVLSPLSAVENLVDRSPPGVYRTPVKAVEGEEVLVMDGVPVSSGGRSLRSVSDSSSSSGSSVKSLYKSENCYSKCQVFLSLSLSPAIFFFVVRNMFALRKIAQLNNR